MGADKMLNQLASKPIVVLICILILSATSTEAEARLQGTFDDERQMHDCSHMLRPIDEFHVEELSVDGNASSLEREILRTIALIAATVSTVLGLKRTAVEAMGALRQVLYAKCPSHGAFQQPLDARTIYSV